MLRRMSAVAASVLLAAQLAVAGEPLSQGSRVRVKINGELADDGSVTPGKGSHSIVGKLLAIDADYVSVAAESELGSFRGPRAAVTDLEVSRGRSRGKGALIGAGIGALVGLG